MATNDLDLELELELGPDLLRRLQSDPNDQDAWRALVELYGPWIVHSCRRWGLQPADAEDVRQDVLLVLARRLPTLVNGPEGNLLGWLRTIAYRRWCRLLDERRRARDASNRVAIAGPDADRDWLDQLAHDADRDWLDQAMRTVRRRVSPRSWAVFYLMALENRPGNEVAERLHIKVSAVFVARGRVQKLLREELLRLNP